MSHFTVRRWFIALVGFGVVTLYGPWAYYGAAPRSFASGEGQIETRVDGAGHGGVHEGPSPMTSSEFRRLADRQSTRPTAWNGGLQAMTRPWTST